jgi:hypothetical protein
MLSCASASPTDASVNATVCLSGCSGRGCLIALLCLLGDFIGTGGGVGLLCLSGILAGDLEDDLLGIGEVPRELGNGDGLRGGSGAFLGCSPNGTSEKKSPLPFLLPSEALLGFLLSGGTGAFLGCSPNGTGANVEARLPLPELAVVAEVAVLGVRRPRG